jgi:electron transfer flavoprotein beta subunit
VRHEWQVPEVYGPDARALDVALDLKASCPGSTVCLLHAGSSQAESWLREALARGCDQAVRLWDGEIAGLGPAGEAAVLAAGAAAAGFDLILIGGANETAPSEQAAAVIAARLGVPCAGRVLAIEPVAQPGRLRLVRGLDAGYEERGDVLLPAVLAVSGSGSESLASLPALLAAQSAEVAVWDLSDLGLAPEALRAAEAAVARRGPRPPRPGLRPVAAPSSALSAFERIQQLLQGTTKRRAGKVVRGTPGELAEEIFQVLLSEGWLDHLAPEAPGGASASGERPPSAVSAPGGEGGTSGGAGAGDGPFAEGGR